MDDVVQVCIGNVYSILDHRKYIPRSRGPKKTESDDDPKLVPIAYNINAESFMQFGGHQLAHLRGGNYEHAYLCYGVFLALVELLHNRGETKPRDLRGKSILRDGQVFRPWRDEELAGALCISLDSWRRVIEDLCGPLRKVRVERFFLRLSTEEATSYPRAAVFDADGGPTFEEAAPLFANAGVTRDRFFLREMSGNARTEQNTCTFTCNEQNRTPAATNAAATPGPSGSENTLRDTDAVHRFDDRRKQIVAAFREAAVAPTETQDSSEPQNTGGLADRDETLSTDALVNALARNAAEAKSSQAGMAFVKLMLRRLRLDAAGPHDQRRAIGAIRQIFARIWDQERGSAARRDRLLALQAKAAEIGADDQNRNPIAVWLRWLDRSKSDAVCR